MKRSSRVVRPRSISAVALLLVTPLSAQVVDPADAQRPPEPELQKEAETWSRPRSWVDDHDDRGDYTPELEIGPSLRWQPLPAMHVDFAPLVGIGPDSRSMDVFLVLGWEI